MGKPAQEWTYGDVDAGFAQCKLVLRRDASSRASNLASQHGAAHCMAYWQNGKCFVHVSSQSQSFIMPALARHDRHQARQTWC